MFRIAAFLKEMLLSLDAMPEKRLIANLLEDGAAVCAIGSVGRSRGIDMSKIDCECPEEVARAFGIATAMASEIEFMNDEGAYSKETDEHRFERIRKWVVENILSEMRKLNTKD